MHADFENLQWDVKKIDIGIRMIGEKPSDYLFLNIEELDKLFSEYKKLKRLMK